MTLASERSAGPPQASAAPSGGSVLHEVKSVGAPHAITIAILAMGGEGGGVLHVRVAGAFALELQHLEPVVIERINAHFGHAAVTRLKMTQGLPAGSVKPRRRPKPLGAAAETALAATVERIGDDRLKQALARLGRAILAEEPKA